MAKSRSETNEELSLEILKLRDGLKPFLDEIKEFKMGKISETRNELFGLEGKAASEYWKGFKLSLSNVLGFEARSGMGAEDGVNALLNYGYGMLRGEVWRNVQIRGLDPYAGYLHADRKGRPSLVFDVMEEFRQQIVDKTVLLLVNRGKVKEDDFTFEDGFCKISDSARKKLIKCILTKFESKINVCGRKRSWSDIIQDQVNLLAEYLEGKSEYNGFYLRW